MSATPLSYVVYDVTMVTYVLEAPVGGSLILLYCVEGQSGQEKTDLEVRKAHYQIDVASAIQLESLLCLSVCIGASEELSNWL